MSMSASSSPPTRTKKIVAVGGAFAALAIGAGLVLRRYWRRVSPTAADASTAVGKDAAAAATASPGEQQQQQQQHAPPSAEDVEKIMNMSRQFKDVGNQHVSRGELDEAKQMYQNAMGLLRHLPPGHPEGTPLLQIVCSNMTLVFLKESRYEDAAFLASCVLQDEDFPVKSNDVKSKLLYRRAQASANMKNIDAALQDLRAAQTIASGAMKDEIESEIKRLS